MTKINLALAKLGLRGEPDPAAWLLARVQEYARSPAGRAGEFTPYPATWFNQERYDDDPAEWQKRGGILPTKPFDPEAWGADRTFHSIPLADRVRLAESLCGEVWQALTATQQGQVVKAWQAEQRK